LSQILSQNKMVNFAILLYQLNLLMVVTKKN